MAIQLKDSSVSIKNLDPSIITILPEIQSVFDFFGAHTVITSGNEQSAHHMSGSLHYEGKALDLRDRTIHPAHRKLAAEMLRFKLGPDYDIVLESDHIHLEFDPKVKP